jgi:hypothetical protein
MDYYDLLADWDSTYQQDEPHDDEQHAQAAVEQPHPLSHDSLIAPAAEAGAPGDDDLFIFTEREWAHLRFLRELVQSGRLSEWDLAPADRSVA